ncbi:MAG: hypothetical protein K0Q58_955 [Microbacterium sp.]|nr:hypothetical protein [Microbacterium sp.]
MPDASRIDFSALDEPVDRQAAIDFETSISERFGLESARLDHADAVVRGVFLGIGAALLGAGVAVLLVMDVLVFVQQTTRPTGLGTVMSYYPLLGVGIAVLVAVLRVRHWRRHDPTTRRYRLHEYKPSPFQKNSERRGYIGLRLDVALPHIVLDSVANDLRGEGTSLRFRVDAAQRLSLEGDFDRFFSLSCPTGYERDALYLFAPDIMQRFVDHAAEFDVEIVDDWLMLSTRAKLATLDREKWRNVLDLVAALEEKLWQWGRWRDEQLVDGPRPGAGRLAGAGRDHGVRRLAPLDPGGTGRRPVSSARSGVAPAGRRLRSRRFRWTSLTAFVLAMALMNGPLILGSILFGS